MGRYLDGRVDIWMAGWIGKKMGGWMDGWKDGWMARWVNGWMDGWRYEWIGEWMGGCMDRPTKIFSTQARGVRGTKQHGRGTRPYHADPHSPPLLPPSPCYPCPGL